MKEMIEWQQAVVTFWISINSLQENILYYSYITKIYVHISRFTLACEFCLVIGQNYDI